MLALVVAVCIVLGSQQPPQGPKAGAEVAPDPRAEFAAALDSVRAKLAKREWKNAVTGLADLLTHFEGSEIARGKLLEIEEIARLTAFWSKHPEPAAKDLLYGELAYYSRESDAVKVVYTPNRTAIRLHAPSRRIPISVPAFDTGEKASSPPPFQDFEQLGQVTIHPLQFNGPYFVELRASIPEQPKYVPMLVFALDDGQALFARLGPSCELQRFSKAGQFERVNTQVESTGLEWGASFTLQVSVNETSITVRSKSKTILTGPKPKDVFGWFGFIGLGKIESITLSGKSYGQWLDALVDAAVEADRNAFDAQFDLHKELPTWLFDVPNKAVRDVEAESAALTLVQSCPADFQKKYDDLARARKWREVLEGLDGVDANAPAPLARAWMRAQALTVLGRIAEARQSAAEVAAAAPKHHASRVLLAVLGARLDPHDVATETARAFVRDFPYDPNGRRLLVRLLVQAGALDEAQREAESAFAAGVDRKVAEKLVKQTRRAVTGPVWRTTNRFESKHYAVASDMDRDTCVQIAGTLEEAYGFYQRTIAPIPASRPRMRVFVFSGKQAYYDYCEDLVGDSMSRTQGMYSQELAQLLFWNASDRGEFLDTARHEGFHQYIHEFVGELPVWLDEGLAQYFETLRRDKKGTLVAGAAPESCLVRLSKLREWPTITQLCDVTRETFYSKEAPTWYSVAWCVVHTLAQGTKEDRTVFDAILARLSQGTDGTVAVREALQGVDLDQLLERVRAHAKPP